MDILDAATLTACRRQDASAFARLVAAYQRPVHALCVALAGPDAEDLAQETFLRVYRAVPRFDPDGGASLKGWILCIARRLCQDRARHLGRGVEIVPPTPVDAIDPATAADDQLVAHDDGARVRRALATLPEDQRAVLALREWDELDYEEIALIEGVPVGTVRSRLARARAALREALSDPEAEQRKEPRVAGA